MATMAHFYPMVNWQSLTLQQLNAYILRVGELHQCELSTIEMMKYNELRQFRIENDI